MEKGEKEFKRREQFLIFGSPLIKEEEVNEVIDSLKTGWLGTGPKVQRFQDDFANYIGSKYALAVNSGTAALHLSLLACGISPQDEVITTPFTFVSTANVILHCGAIPKFVDVDRHTMNINPDLIERAITPKSRAIIPVHIAGRPCEMDKILELARKYELKVIEDAAHCIEGIYKGRKIGTIGDFTCFSFYATKNLATGEGGMITTDDDNAAEKIRMLSLHGLSDDAWKRYSSSEFKHYEVTCPGYKYNMMDIQAALGIHQLKRLNENLRRREEIWKRYDQAFADLPIITPAPPEPFVVHARHLYTILIDKDRVGISRDEFARKLRQLNIGTGIHFLSVHLHKYYRETFGFKPDDFPEANYLSQRTLSLPLSAKLTDEDVEDVINTVRFICEKS